jgi:GalNAc-alpha-(1->4)-GalNAc-alpha-(1->3)-diNAcBac-PP-undecaprenol alpha-1,4-N-acetyl-D-galactosaminyltransferase
MPESEGLPATAMPRNILMFIDGLGSGGAQRQFVNLACGLAKKGHSVTVAVYNDQDHFAGALKVAGIGIVRLEKPSRWSIRPIVGLARLYRRIRADVVITFLRSPTTKAELAKSLCPGMRIIAAERSVYPPAPLPMALRITQNLHRRASFITVNSANQLARMEQEFPFLSDRCVYIDNAIDVPAETIATRPIADQVVRLAAVGSLMPYKNSVLLARAVALLRDRFDIRAEISWLGETFQHLENYGAYRETCATIGKQALEGQWTWLAPRKDVGKVLKAHDALVHPSRIEGMSNAVCEAMALGLPVIAARIGDHARLIEGSGAGLLFQPDSVASLAEAIAEFAALDVPARTAMGKIGKTVIERDFSHERMVANYELLVEAVIQDSGKLPPELVRSSASRSSCAA